MGKSPPFIVHYSTEHESGARGCFFASCVSTSVGEVEGVEERMMKATEETNLRLAARFDLEKEKGTLPDDFPSRERGQLLYDLRQGYVFRGRIGWTEKSLVKDIEHRVSMVLGH